MIIDFITRFFDRKKLEKLTKDLKQKQETANELKSKSDNTYNDFKHDYNAWLDIEERRLRKSGNTVQSTASESSPQPGGTAEDDSGSSGSRRE
jgi:hypothetical protein